MGASHRPAPYIPSRRVAGSSENLSQAHQPLRLSCSKRKVKRHRVAKSVAEDACRVADSYTPTVRRQNILRDDHQLSVPLLQLCET